MKYSPRKPEIYEKIIKYLPHADWDKGIAICYGDTIYSKNPISPDIASHEEIHMYQQQELGPEEWWDKYLKDKAFRFSQELEAYQYQVKFIKLVIKDRNVKYKMIHRLAIDISSDMYDNMISYSQAMTLLK